MAERTLAVRLTTGGRAERRVWPTPAPGLLIAADLDEWTILVEGDRTGLGWFADPEAALACAIEIGPLADWPRAGSGRLGLSRPAIRQIAAIFARLGGGDVAGQPGA